MAREYLISWRRQRNESQQDVADSVGVSRQYYAMIEDGSRQKKMDVTLLTALARHFDVSAAEIVEMETGGAS